MSTWERVWVPSKFVFTYFTHIEGNPECATADCTIEYTNSFTFLLRRLEY